MLLPHRTAARVLVAILLLSTFSPASAFADKSFSLDTARNNLTYVVSQLASFFSDLADAIATYIPGTSLTASAATPTPSPIAPPTPALDFLAMTTPEVSTPPTTVAAPYAPQTTIIQQPVIERIVERTVPAPAASGISEQTLAGRLASLKDDLLLRIAAVASAPIAFSGSAPTTPVSTATFATSQRIDQLTNTAINTPTITGGTITGASISGTITASGVLNAGSLVFSDASATSTFAGGATFATGGGNVGIGTSTPGSLLSVAGDAYASGFYNTSGVTGGYKIDGNLILQASSTLNSFFIGQFAGNASTTGLQNYGLGTFALISITTGDFNNAMGRAAMNALTTGSSNTAMGNEALRLNTTGSDNVAIGMFALRMNASATSSVAVGSNAGNAAANFNNQGGTYVGYQAGYGARTNSDFNTLFGYQAGRGITTGSNNIWIGTATSSAGIANLTTGSQNILIGNNISLPSATASGQLNIGNIIYGTGIAGTGSTVSSGNVGIGTTTPWGKLSIKGSGTGTGLAFAVADSANTPRFVIQDNGNVGIGTTTPSNRMHVYSTTNADGISVDGTTNPAFTLRSSGSSKSYFSLATAADAWLTGASANDTVIRNDGGNIHLGTNTTARFSILSTGNIGIGTTTPSRVLTAFSSTAPQLSLSAGAGSNEWTFRNAGGVLYIATSTYSATSSVSAFTLDANGNLTIVGSATTCTIGNGTSATSCSSSDERLKDDVTPLATESGLAAIQALNPVSFHWNSWMQSAGNASSTQFGLIAQQVQSVFPNLVQEDANTHYYKLDYQGLIAPMIKAIQEIASISGAFKTNLVAWLGSASNGIGDLFAKDIYATNGTFNRVTAQALCAEDICVTRDQLAAVLALIGQTSGSPSANAPEGTPQAPVIELNGNASSTIELGDTYNDLGARVVAPESDLNLGIVILLDGATTTAVSIDTNTPGEHTILYTVTSPTTGLTGSATRTVIISPAEQAPSPEPENDNPFNAVPANDNASSTTAVDTAA